MRLRRWVDRRREENPLSDEAARVAYSGMYGGYRTEYRGVAMLRAPCESVENKSLQIERNGNYITRRNFFNCAEQHHLKTQKERWRVYKELSQPGVRDQIIRTERFARRVKRTAAAVCLLISGTIIVGGCGSSETHETDGCTDEITALQGPADTSVCDISSAVSEG